MRAQWRVTTAPEATCYEEPNQLLLLNLPCWRPQKGKADHPAAAHGAGVDSCGTSYLAPNYLPLTGSGSKTDPEARSLPDGLSVRGQSPAVSLKVPFTKVKGRQGPGWAPGAALQQFFLILNARRQRTLSSTGKRGFRFSLYFLLRIIC